MIKNVCNPNVWTWNGDAVKVVAEVAESLLLIHTKHIIIVCMMNNIQLMVQ